jgi:hypothetical protein
MVNAQYRSGSQDASQFNMTSGLIFTLALLVLAVSQAQTFYRLSLPWDGWSFSRNLTGSGRQLVFYQNLAAGSSRLQSGDVLLAVEDQPLEELLASALTLQPRRPANWFVGGTTRYTVLRGGEELTLSVPLIHLNPVQIASSIGSNLLLTPSLLPALLLGFYVFFRRPRSRAARLFFLLSVCFFASEGISQVVRGSNVIGPAEMFYADAFWLAWFFNALIWPYIVAPIYVHLFLIFPVVKEPIHRYPRLTLALLYGWMPGLTLLALGLSRGQPLAFWSTWSIFNGLDYFLVLLIAIFSLGHTLLTVRNPAERAQVRWVAWGSLITSTGALVGGLMALLGVLGANPFLDFIFYRLLFLAFPLALAIAILHYHLFDIDILINRTLVYGALTAALVLVYFGSIVLLQEIFRALTGQASQLAIVASTLAIVALFNPLRQRIQNTIDRRFYRPQYDTVKTLATFSATVRDEVDLDKLTAELLAIVEETMQPKEVSLWLRSPTGGWDSRVKRREI